MGQYEEPCLVFVLADGPAFINVTRNTTVRFGQHLELRCDADGQSNITWKKLGKGEGTIVSREKVIVVENVTWSDAGEYECEARTGLGSRRSGVAVTVVGRYQHFGTFDSNLT